MSNNEIIFPFPNISAQDKTLLVAWYIDHVDTRDNGNIVQVVYGKEQKLTLRLSFHFAKAQKLLESATAITNQNESPGIL